MTRLERRVVFSLLLGCFLSGCSPEACSRKADDAEPRQNGDEQISREITEDDGWLYVMAHDSQASDASYLAIELGDDPENSVQSRQPFTREAIALDDHRGSHRAPAAQFGASVVVGVPDGGDENDYRLILYESGEKRREIAVGDIEPVALHRVAEAVFIGTYEQLFWVDLSDSDPKPQLLATHEEKSWRPVQKPYDLFARSGNRLVAIDDEVEPFFADFFALDDEGRPTHLADWTLPGLINGTYRDAELVRGDEGEEFALVTQNSFGSLDRSGQNLAAMPVRGEELQVEPDWVLDSGAPDELSVIGESRTYEEARGEPRIIAGEEFSAWQGMAVAPDDDAVLLAAGKRGLITVPYPLDSDGEAEIVDVDGECLDVVVTPGGVFALVENPDGETDLAVLHRDGTDFAIVGRHELDGRFTSFVPR